MQTALDAYLVTYNEKRPHQGRGMKGRTPIQVFLEGRPKSNSPRKETPKRQLDPQPAAASSSTKEQHCQAITVAVQAATSTTASPPSRKSILCSKSITASAKRPGCYTDEC
jgi:hypothetical protein